MDDFFIASIPEPVRILGLNLRPYSLGHVVLLNRIGSAFVTGEKPTFEDLAASVLICALTYKEGLSSLHDSQADRDKFMRLWYRRLTGGGWFRKKKPLQFQRSRAAFRDYLGESSKIPYYTYDPGEMREIRCPQVQVVKVALMSQMHFSEDEIMDRSWALCMSDFVILRALRGEVTLTDRDAIAEAQEFANRLAENLAKKGVKVNGTS